MWRQRQKAHASLLAFPVNLPSEHVMGSDFFFSDVVRICIPVEADGSAEAEVVLKGRVAAATSNILSITVHDMARHNSGAIMDSVPCVVRKSTPFGLMEFDATGCSHWDKERLTLTVTLEGPKRRVQRREACRIELRSEARYRDLRNVSSAWKTAEVHDVSISGASLRLRGEAFDVGSELLVEFSLFDRNFSLPCTVRRIETQTDHTVLYALEYFPIDTQLQDRLAKAISQLQTKIISSRVKID